MKLSAVLFDLDGTVIADEDEYGEAFAKVLASFGVKVTSKYPHIRGIGMEENWRIFINKYNLKTDKTVEELGVLTQEEYIKLIPNITLREGFEEMVNELRDSGVKIALATSNTWSIVEKLFDVLGIEDLFDSVTTGEEVSLKKPDPQIFLIASEKLATDPQECLIFEDSQAGIDAAHAAGMRVIAVARSDQNKNELKDADQVINEFTDINPEKIFNLA